MDVWVVEFSWVLEEGASIWGVFSTEQLAKEFVASEDNATGAFMVNKYTIDEVCRYGN